MKKEIIKFISPALEKKRYTFQVIIKSLLSGLNPLIHILFIEQIVSQFELFNKSGVYNILVLYCLYIIVYEIIDGIIHNWGWFGAVPELIMTIQERFFRKYLQIDNNFVESIGTGKSISIIEKGIYTWSRLIDMFLSNVIQLVIGFVFAIVLISNFNSLFGIGFLIVYIFTFFVVMYFNNKMIDYRKKRNEEVHYGVKKMIRGIMNKNEILQSSKINQEINSQIDSVKKGKHYNLKMAPYYHITMRFPVFMIVLFKVILLYILSYGYFLAEITLSQIVLIIGLLTVLESNIIKFIHFFKDFTKEFIDVEKLWDFFDNAPQIQGYEEGNKFSHKKGEINIEKLNFGYVENKNIFTDFSLNIEGEKVLALVGDSGSGKSTLAKMIAGYMRPDSGEIIVDGQKLSGVSLKSYYRDIGYLTQDPSVFDGSILENLTYALEEKISDEKIKEIITQAKCEFIYDLPNGLETQIGERGVKLSGGQKQRLAIAKIFLKDPKIIILDEPTSALDSFSEEQITKAMQNLFINRTVIVIAHRLQTVKHAHRILVLENGEILEDGNHESLVKKDGKYAKMLELQSGF